MCTTLYRTLCKQATLVSHLTNFSFEFFYKIFTEDASRSLLYHGAKKSKMTKNSNQGGSCLKIEQQPKARSEHPRSLWQRIAHPPAGFLDKALEEQVEKVDTDSPCC